MLFNAIRDQLIELSYQLENKKVVVWGTGKAGKFVGFILSNFHFNIKQYYYVDNDAKKWGNTLFGKQIFSPTQIATENQADIVVLVASDFGKEIIAQLKDEYELKENVHWLLNPLPSINAVGEVSPAKGIFMINLSES